MPGELRNPENMFPYHYETMYNPGTNSLEPKELDVDKYIQSIAIEVRGYKLNPSEMDNLYDRLEYRGMSHRNPGDEDFRAMVIETIKDFQSAKKVVKNARSK